MVVREGERVDPLTALVTPFIFLRSAVCPLYVSATEVAKNQGFERSEPPTDSEEPNVRRCRTILAS